MGELGRVRPISISLRHVNLDVQHTSLLTRRVSTSRILHDITLDAKPGQLVALLGGSGAGKSSLLNTIAQRIHGNSFKMSGEMAVNGLTEPSAVAQVFRESSGYVLQADQMLPHLSVRETLRFAAALRLPRALSAAEKRAQVEAVILELGLKECAETCVGGAHVRGVSGGERRRVSIATQLLTNPVGWLAGWMGGTGFYLCCFRSRTTAVALSHPVLIQLVVLS